MIFSNFLIFSMYLQFTRLLRFIIRFLNIQRFFLKLSKTILLRMIRWINIRSKKLSSIIYPNIQMCLHSLTTCIIINLSFALDIQTQHGKFIGQNRIIAYLLINPTSLTLHTTLMFLLPPNLLKQPAFDLNLLWSLI